MRANPSADLHIFVFLKIMQWGQLIIIIIICILYFTKKFIRNHTQINLLKGKGYISTLRPKTKYSRMD